MTACADLPVLPSWTLAQQIPAGQSLDPAMWWWALLFGLALGFVLWAALGHHPGLSDAVRKGPRWFRVSIFVGFTALLWHLFVQGRKKVAS